MLVERWVRSILHEVVDAEPNDDASYEELDVANEAFSRSSLDTINIQLPIHIDVIRTVEGSDVTEAVLG